MNDDLSTDLFPALQDWASEDGFNVPTLEDAVYPTLDEAQIDFSLQRSMAAKARKCNRPTVSDSPSSIHSSSPDEANPCVYHIPSPTDDDAGVDPGALTKKKRREQNRAAQRAFRDRKEFRLKQLENCILELKMEQRALEMRYNNLRTAHLRLKSGLKILLDASGTFDE